jgi:hypothetical protein
MDWIEKIFGWNPDNGDGSFEAIIVAVCCFVVLALIFATAPKARAYARRLLGSLTARS